jgi:hypothetical protein
MSRRFDVQVVSDLFLLLLIGIGGPHRNASASPILRPVAAVAAAAAACVPARNLTSGQVERRDLARRNLERVHRSTRHPLRRRSKWTSDLAWSRDRFGGSQTHVSHDWFGDPRIVRLWLDRDRVLLFLPVSSGRGRRAFGEKEVTGLVRAESWLR